MSDPCGANVALLMHMEGANNSTTFTDSSLFPKTITRYGDAKISTAQSKWGQGSGYFDQSGDSLSAGDHNDFTFGAGDFTIETFLYLDKTPKLADGSYYSAVVAKDSATGREFWLRIGGTVSTYDWIQLAITPNGSNFATCTPLISTAMNQWYHLAAVRAGNSLMVFRDGVLLATDSAQNYTIANTSTALTIGRDSYNTTNEFGGYLQDLRITKGVARYTANFTPPAARLPDPDPVTGLIISSGFRADYYDGGNYRIVGNVDELGVAGSYRVRLFDRQSARCLRETWSAADGSYVFPNIAYRERGYFAVAYDHGDNPLNAAIADLITPELMP